jgi:hypothetical protein
VIRKKRPRLIVQDLIVLTVLWIIAAVAVRRRYISHTVALHESAGEPE